MSDHIIPLFIFTHNNLPFNFDITTRFVKPHKIFVVDSLHGRKCREFCQIKKMCRSLLQHQNCTQKSHQTWWHALQGLLYNSTAESMEPKTRWKTIDLHELLSLTPNFLYWQHLPTRKKQKRTAIFFLTILHLLAVPPTLGFPFTSVSCSEKEHHCIAWSDPCSFYEGRIKVERQHANSK